MIRLILVTFLFLGWAFYELSGGSAFQPEERVVAVTETIRTPDEGIEIVTRGADPTLASLAVPERLVQPLIEPAVDTAAADVAAIIEEVAADPVTAEPATLVPTADLTADLREVAGSRVNMRTGPGTDFGVVTTLDEGTLTEVLQSDPGGWVKLRVVENGVEGWIAERLLITIDG